MICADAVALSELVMADILPEISRLAEIRFS